MSDIVERLRSRSPYLHGSSAERVMEEAAEKIERLETANEYSFNELTAARAEIERLREELADVRADAALLRADNNRLRAILRDLRPDIERLELCEASAEDGNTPRLQMLRRALEPMP